MKWWCHCLCCICGLPMKIGQKALHNLILLWKYTSFLAGTSKKPTSLNQNNASLLPFEATAPLRNQILRCLKAGSCDWWDFVACWSEEERRSMNAPQLPLITAGEPTSSHEALRLTLPSFFVLVTSCSLEKWFISKNTQSLVNIICP